MNSKWIIHLNMKGKVKLLEERGYPNEAGVGKDFKNNSRNQTGKKWIKQNSSKLKTAHQKRSFKKLKGKP